MHARFQAHIEAGLESLQRHIDSAKSPIGRSQSFSSSDTVSTALNGCLHSLTK